MCICLEMRLVADKLHHIMASFPWLLYNFHFNVLKGDYCTVTDNGWGSHIKALWTAVFTLLRFLSSPQRGKVKRGEKKTQNSLQTPQSCSSSSPLRHTEGCHAGKSPAMADSVPERRWIALNCLSFPTTPSIFTTEQMQSSICTLLLDFIQNPQSCWMSACCKPSMATPRYLTILRSIYLWVGRC